MGSKSIEILMALWVLLYLPVACLAELSPFQTLIWNCPSEEKATADLVLQNDWPALSQDVFNQLWAASLKQLISLKDARDAASQMRINGITIDKQSENVATEFFNRIQHDFMSGWWRTRGLMIVAWKQKIRVPEDADTIALVLSFDTCLNEDTVERLSLPTPFPAMNWIGAFGSDRAFDHVVKHWQSYDSPRHYWRQVASCLIARFPGRPGEAESFLNERLRRLNFSPPDAMLDAVRYGLVNGVRGTRVRKLSPPIFEGILEKE